MKILMTGASGLIGRSLCRSLTSDGNAVVSLSHSGKHAGLDVAEVFHWNYKDGMPPSAAFSEVEAIVNLAGEPIAAKRWTDEQKRSIRDSRVLTTKTLVDAVRSLDIKPRVFVNGSAVGFYGDRGDELLEESAKPGRGFMSEVCEEWEREGMRAGELGIRALQVRTGVVLSAKGGALEKMLPPFKLGVGGRLGSGRQWFPWIHIDDIVGIFRHAIYNADAGGPLNGAAPEGVRNSEFTRELARALHRPAFLPVPQAALKVLMGEMADVLFDSQHVVPKATLECGYRFQFPALGPALESLFGRPS